MHDTQYAVWPLCDWHSCIYLSSYPPSFSLYYPCIFFRNVPLFHISFFNNRTTIHMYSFLCNRVSSRDNDRDGSWLRRLVGMMSVLCFGLLLCLSILRAFSVLSIFFLPYGLYTNQYTKQWALLASVPRCKNMIYLPCMKDTLLSQYAFCLFFIIVFLGR